MNEVDFSCFEGIRPDMKPNEVYDLLGDPDETEIHEDGDDVYKSLYFYLPDGRITIYADITEESFWGVEFRPKYELFISDILKSKKNITNKINYFYCDDKLKFKIYLEENDNTIEHIEWDKN